jgi:hypothetical protein
LLADVVATVDIILVIVVNTPFLLVAGFGRNWSCSGGRVAAADAKDASDVVGRDGR